MHHRYLFVVAIFYYRSHLRDTTTTPVRLVLLSRKDISTDHDWTPIDIQHQISRVFAILLHSGTLGQRVTTASAWLAVTISSHEFTYLKSIAKPCENAINIEFRNLWDNDENGITTFEWICPWSVTQNTGKVSTLFASRTLYVSVK